jgi:hypothetical protein
MAGRECYHCKQWVAAGEAHDCWTTTEAALTRDLPEDLHEAWARLREFGASLGDQRIYASHNSIMFARRACYFFVRPKKTFLEVCVFMDRVLTAPQVRRSARPSKVKVVNILHIRHRDEVEAPVTDWLKDAYRLAGVPAARTVAKPCTPEPTPQAKRKPKLERPAATPAAKRPAGRSKRKTTRNR